MILISYLSVALPSARAREGSFQNRDKIEESFTWKYFSMIRGHEQMTLVSQIKF